jgi:hypothetical protein
MLGRILTWAHSLNEPSEATNGLPTCPYAKCTFDEGRVSIVFKTQFNGASDILRLVECWSDRFDVFLLVVDRSSLSATEAHALADKVSAESVDTDLIVMADHPDKPFIVAGHNNSNGEYLIFFIQRRSRLLKASAALKPTGYYRNW